MMTGRITHNGITVLEFHAERNGQDVLGQVTSEIPGVLVELFSLYEEYVNDQLFSHVDELEQRIEACGFLVCFSDGSVFPARHLQICPTEGTLSFVVGSSEGCDP